MYQILKIRNGEHITEIGEYVDHEWVPHISRPATAEEILPFKDHKPTLLLTIPPPMTTTQQSGSFNTHARLAPSAASRWSKCTASVAFHFANAHKIPKDTSSEFSREGTEAHEWAAKVLLSQISINDVPENFRPHIKSYVDHCMSLVPEGVVPQVEVEVPLFYQPEKTGTCDFAILTSERVTIRDYKNGMGVLVEAEGNVQLAIYAYSFIREMQDIMEFCPETIVDIDTHQPRHREATNDRPWILTLKELEEFCNEIEYASIQANTGLERVRDKLKPDGRDIGVGEILEAAPGLKFHPEEGDHGSCRWCVSKGWCDVRNKAITESLSIPDHGVSGEALIGMMPDLDKAEKKLPVGERIEKRFEKMGLPAGVVTDEYLVRIYRAEKWMKSLFADVEEYLETRALNGDIAEGLKIVEGRAGNRSWACEAQADVFLRGQGLRQDERYEYKLKSPTKIEELLAEKLKNTRTRNRFAELVTRSTPKKTIALDTDKRESVAPTIASMPDLAIEDSSDAVDIEAYEV